MTPEIAKTVHDIRNPLNRISMNAELGKLLMSDTDVDHERIESLFNSINQACEDCAAQLVQLSTQLKSENS